MNTRFINLIRVAGAPKVTVIGDLILDSYLQGDTNRISPEAPIQVLDVRGERFALGGAANVALNLRNLGADVAVCGVVGKDTNGQLVQAMLKDRKIGHSAVLVDPSRPTINKTRVVARNQQLVRIDREIRSPLEKKMEDALFEAIIPLVRKSDMVILSDYAKGLLSDDLIRRLVQASPENIVVDPKGLDFVRYRGCRLITPNRKEAETATGIQLHGMDDLNRASDMLFEKIGLRELLITLGSDGIFYADQNGQRQIVPTRARSVYDVTGAGDTVIATLTFCLAAGMDFDDAVRIANAAAGIVVGKLGVAAPTREELIHFFGKGFTAFQEKIL
ncbi:MAG: D-glycero-beta-D-manno-heptose-7-phosphate kinase, partial [Planctomycetes bacterium]|nr:D-glycero-beta-D-manno-heptose-7-phosphate kinase [Planctomycetota bacterium]